MGAMLHKNARFRGKTHSCKWYAHVGYLANGVINGVRGLEGQVTSAAAVEDINRDRIQGL